MASSQAPNLGFNYGWTLGESGWNVQMDENLIAMDALILISVLSATTTAEPGSPTEGDRYIIPASATGTNWAGNDGKVAVYSGGAWLFFTASNGWKIEAIDTSQIWEYRSGWRERIAVLSAANTITASTTQSQGQQPLTANINEISVCANANDVVTLPAILKGCPITVINNGANTLQIYPASGEDLGAGTNTSVTVTAGNVAKFEGYAAGSAVQII
jgi:hypothetical protein